mgnify:CR=1 FL=1
MQEQKSKIMYDEARQYWQEMLSGDFQELFLECDYQSGNSKNLKPEKMEFEIKQNLSDKLIKVCKSNDMMLYVYLMSAFEVMFYLLTGTKKIRLGVPALTTGPSTENLGILTQSTIDPAMSFRSFLNAVKRKLLTEYQYQAYTMEEALIEADCHTPYEDFVKYVVALESLHTQEAADTFLDSLHSDFIISFAKSTTLTGIIHYNPNHVSREFLQVISSVYQYIIDQTLQNLDLPLKEIVLADKEELEKLKSWNQTRYLFENEKTADQFFEDIAAQYGGNAAGVYVANKGLDDVFTINYETLNTKSNQLAHILLKHGVEKGDAVGVLMSNSLDLIIAMLGIMKAGAAFLPLDIEYPEERINAIANDVKMKWLLTNLEKEIVSVPDTTVLKSDMLAWKEASKESVSVMKTLEDTAYILYTSGSTGVPKGVRVSHRNLMNFILWRVKAYQYSDKEISLQLISPAFDGSLTNILPVLLSGGSCVLIHNQLWRDIRFVNQVIKTQKITNFSLVPTLYRMLAEQADMGEWDSIRFIVLAGESTKPALCRLTQEKFPHVTLMNEYGPTEATITAAAKQNMDADNCNCIGKPIDNTAVYILNEEHKILPAGLTGELSIAGEGVVKGYIGRNEESQQKFIVSPFNQDMTLYLTGDKARWNQNGELEYLGRKDRLVKLHGLRIELEEITSVLLEQDGISDAYVWIYKEKEQEELVAVVEAKTKVDLDVVKEKVSEKLPHYMVPGILRQVTALPMNCNGKIAVDELNHLVTLEEASQDQGELNETEQFFVELWGNILQHNNFNINSRFFDIGGNSLLIMLMNNEVEKKYPGILTIPDYFTCFTIKKLAETVIERTGNQ